MEKYASIIKDDIKRFIKNYLIAGELVDVQGMADLEEYIPSKYPYLSILYLLKQNDLDDKYGTWFVESYKLQLSEETNELKKSLGHFLYDKKYVDELKQENMVLEHAVNQFRQENMVLKHEVNQFRQYIMVLEHEVDQFRRVNMTLRRKVDALSDSIVSDSLLSDTTDVEHMVINASGQEFFPNNMDIQTKKTCLHKIEVNEKCEVRLANRSISVPAGECVYVVASGGKYVLLLRRELECKFFHVKLINKPGKFASDLLVSFKTMEQNVIRYSDVISFSIINDRDLIVIHSDGKIEGDGAPTLSAIGFNAIYTDSDFNNYNGFILYELSSANDRNVCFIKPTSGGITNVCYAGYNNMGELIKQC